MIKHFLKDNKVVFQANLELRKSRSEMLLLVNKSTIENYINEKNISVGSPINTSAVAGNWSADILQAQWTYNISREQKKILINSLKGGILSEETKKSSPRDRVKKITESKRQIKDTTSEQETTAKKPRRRTTRRKSTKSANKEE